MPWPWASAKNKCESDVSNEVLYILVGQEATKISEGKVGRGIQKNPFLNKNPQGKSFEYFLGKV